MKHICLSLMAYLICSNITHAQSKNFIDQPYIEVTGSADTLVTPNLIYLKIVISEADSKGRNSLEEQENKMVNVIKLLGIDPEKNLTAGDMLSNYRHYVFRKKDILKSKEYILKVSSAEIASLVFLRLEDLGISNASLYKTDHTDVVKLKNACRIKAIENGHAKAINLTKAIGQTIGNAIFISDNEELVNFNTPNLYNYKYDKDEFLYSKKGYEPEKINFEKIKISATISAKYVLK